MPETTSVVADVPPPPPASRDQDALDWLRYQGITPRYGVIRSSSITSALRDPFGYYLTDRLGLVSPFAYSIALSRGSWFHTCFEHFSLPEGEYEARLQAILAARLQELAAMCAAAGVIGDSRTQVLNRERQDALVAASWFGAAIDHPLDAVGSLREYLTTRMRVLAHECRLYTRLPLQARVSLTMIAQLDALLLDPSTGTLWIGDVKTTSDDPKERMEICPVEMQSWHYAWVVENLLEQGVIQAHFSLPEETRLAGIVHFVVRKPTIEMCGKDRAFTLDETPLKSGPRKGQPRNEKIYHGEPLPELYALRVADWFHGRNEHLDLRPKWDASPPVNISWTKREAFNHLDDRDHDYYNALSVIANLAGCVPTPDNFPRYVSSLNPPSPVYLPFYTSPVSAWPSIIRDKGLISRFRDGDHERYPSSNPRVELSL